MVQGAKTAFKHLLLDARNDDPRVRAKALSVLSELDRDEVADALVAATKDPDPRVRLQAVLGIFARVARLHAQKVGRAERLTNNSGTTPNRAAPPRTPGAATLAETDLYYAPLLPLLNDRHGDVRAWAVKAMGVMQDRRAVPLLILLLKYDPDESLRHAAVYALETIGDRRAVEPLIRALQEDSPTVRWRAAGALGELGDTRAIEPLVNALDDAGHLVPDPIASAVGVPVGEIAKQSLQRFGALAVEPLILALAHPHEFVRLRAIEALTSIGDERAIAPLEKVVREDEKATVKREARYALRKLGHKPDAAVK